MSDGSPVTPQLDARMLADLREWRARVDTNAREAGRWSMRLTLDELDMLLRIADERDALKREACADPDEPARPVEIRHSMTCNVPNAGGCYVPSCSCPCHKASA